jgi:hypothetical protein
LVKNLYELVSAKNLLWQETPRTLGKLQEEEDIVERMNKDQKREGEKGKGEREGESER